MQIIKTNGTELDSSGSYIEYDGKKDHGVSGYNAIPNVLIQRAITNIGINLESLRMPIYNFDKRLMLYYNGWTGSEYDGRAYATHVIIGAMFDKPTIENVSPLVIHELGHAFMYKTMGCTYEDHMTNEKLQEYIKLRGIPNSYTSKSQWKKRPAEIFAEDFRYLFGDKNHKSLEFKTFDSDNAPSEEIKEFMLGLIEEEVMEFKDVDKLDWFYNSIKKVNEKGIMTGYKDGEFKPNQSITRAEIAVIASRLLEVFENDNR